MLRSTIRSNRVVGLLQATSPTGQISSPHGSKGMPLTDHGIRKLVLAQTSPAKKVYGRKSFAVTSASTKTTISEMIRLLWELNRRYERGKVVEATLAWVISRLVSLYC